MPEENIHIKPHAMCAAVADTIYSRRMLQQGDRVLVGVSGGADSVALLHILLQFSASLGLNIGVAHLNHALREEASDRDAAFVTSLAQRLGLPCYSDIKDIDMLRRQTGEGIEAAGRWARYEFYDRTAKQNGYGKIALGHHADDNAELVLMNLLRGSGPGGISGIPPTRGLSIIRPLIDVRRRDILSYLYANDLPFVVDASNQNPRFLRNRVRNELIPELSKTYNPKFSEALVRIASISRAEEEWLKKMVADLLAAASLATGKRRWILSVAYLSGLHIAALRRVVRSALEHLDGNLNGITFRHVDAVIDIVFRKSGQSECHLPRRIRVRRQGNRLLMIKEKHSLREMSRDHAAIGTPRYCYDVHRPVTQSTSVSIRQTGQRLAFSAIKREDLSGFRTTGQESAFFDMEKLYFPLLLRNHQIGDRFTPLGMKGSQKVQKFFINVKIGRTQRPVCPILLSRGQVIWVVGHRMDERFKIGPETRYVLKAELLLA
ncbi:MAG: tRNA lysidine(34) synthetase TilS [Deltaproteobacteria bacterium]|nr:tRNA lysidine(34) synthetase TilS [Deltaproteobacteria bacterium]